MREVVGICVSGKGSHLHPSHRTMTQTFGSSGGVWFRVTAEAGCWACWPWELWSVRRPCEAAGHSRAFSMAAALRGIMCRSNMWCPGAVWHRHTSLSCKFWNTVYLTEVWCHPRFRSESMADSGLHLITFRKWCLQAGFGYKLWEEKLFLPSYYKISQPTCISKPTVGSLTTAR